MNNTDSHLPFILRIAAKWKKIKEMETEEEECILFQRKAKLTGCHSLTNYGNDIHISDIGFFNDLNFNRSEQ